MSIKQYKFQEDPIYSLLKKSQKTLTFQPVTVFCPLKLIPVAHRFFEFFRKLRPKKPYYKVKDFRNIRFDFKIDNFFAVNCVPVTVLHVCFRFVCVALSERGS